jgi:hypothetical protein
MVTQIAKFQTSDGKVFDNETDAMTHESSLKNAGVVDAFLDKYYPIENASKKQGPRRTIVRKGVLTWLAAQGTQPAA